MNKISSLSPSLNPGTSAQPGIGPVIGDESPSQLFRSMLSGNLARMTLPYPGAAPLPGPRPVPSAPEQAKPSASGDDGISDTQREEARLSARNGSKAPAPAAANRKADAQPDGSAVEEPMPAAPQAESQQSDAEGKAAKAANAAAPAEGTAKSVNEADKTSKAARSEVHTDARSETAAADKANDTDAPPAGDAAATPPLLDPAALQAAAQLKDQSAGAEADAADNGAAGAGKRPAAIAGNAARDAQAATDVADAAGNSTAAQGDAASSATATSTFAGLLGAARSGPATAAMSGAAAAAHTDAGALAALQGAGNASSGSAVASNGTAPAAAPSQLVLAQPLHDPSFASEMAAKLSVLASKGVQEAHLHLNPAEMGPVAVQIVVDGQQARISFHAEQADTRAVLEHSLPDLAAALRDTGLTLSGGGVFQQASGSGEGGGAFQQARDGNAAAASANARSQRMADESLPALGRSSAATRTTRGVLDLYA